MVVSCVLPLWLVISSQRLWLPANPEHLERAERSLYEAHVKTKHGMHLVAGLGTIHVPYHGPNKNQPPRTLVLVHGYMAGNAFWAAVS